MGDVVLKALVSYITSHPEIIEKLVALLLNELVAHLDAQQKPA